MPLMVILSMRISLAGFFLVSVAATAVSLACGAAVGCVAGLAGCVAGGVVAASETGISYNMPRAWMPSFLRTIRAVGLVISSRWTVTSLVEGRIRAPSV